MDKFFLSNHDDHERQDALNDLIIDSVLKKYKTVFIGSIDAIDKTMGFLWGYGRPIDELSEDERSWLPIRAELRKLILDNGNKQMRDAEDQLSGYDFVQKKFFLT